MNVQIKTQQKLSKQSKRDKTQLFLFMYISSFPYLFQLRIMKFYQYYYIGIGILNNLAITK